MNLRGNNREENSSWGGQKRGGEGGKRKGKGKSAVSVRERERKGVPGCLCPSTKGEE